MVAPTSDVILDRLMALHPKIIDLSLGRMHRLLEAVGNPQNSLAPVVHVAGTNGKGSTLAMVRAGLEAAGRRVQVYTSPHLARFHERVRLADGLISEAALAEALEACEVANGGEPITYFEITTVAALLAFSRDPADYCLWEVGLGGRLDATNVVDQPKITAITPVASDHQQYLGETLAEIAAEKAGILKPGVTSVVAEQSDSAFDVIEGVSDRVGAPLLSANRDWQVWEEHGRLAFQDSAGLVDLPRPALIGAHQIQNAGTALAVLRALGMDDAACEAAMTDVEWPARLQRLRSGPLVERAGTTELWLDGGHNEAAGAAIAEALGRLPERPTVLVCGMLRTKDVRAFLAPLNEMAEHLWAISIPDTEATLSADETVKAASGVGFSAHTADDLDAALHAALKVAAGGRILICGSLYLAGHVLRQNAAPV